jgi:hypothetical protein
MPKRIGAFALLAGVAFLLYLYTQPAYTQRFRLTIEVHSADQSLRSQ